MTVHIDIDREACNGYGNCVIAAPEVFDLEPGTSIAYVLPGHPTEADRDAVEEAVADCPVQALKLRRP
ncbi:ferredoxin [Nocardioides zeae]|uniref:Ferredoxin n=1 Tax=Nocardioides zeae TaxID=1457234 RepID=A0AAJ1X2A6_9ACTN|nr:ferredoxin [Nocardioides zeae]MDQ1105696.1 ferredoxin [Nocardioides zeae]